MNVLDCSIAEKFLTFNQVSFLELRKICDKGLCKGLLSQQGLRKKLPHLWSKFDKLGIFGIRMEFSISSLKDDHSGPELSSEPEKISQRFG